MTREKGIRLHARRVLLALILLVGGACASTATTQVSSGSGVARSSGGFSGMEPPPGHRKWPEKVVLSPKTASQNLSRTQLEVVDFAIDSVVATLDPPNGLLLSFAGAEESVATRKRLEVNSAQVIANGEARRKLFLGRFEPRIADGPLAAWEGHDKHLMTTRSGMVQLSGGLDRVTVSRVEANGSTTIVGFYADAWSVTALLNPDQTISEPPKVRGSPTYYELTVRSTGPAQYIVTDMVIEMTDPRVFDDPDASSPAPAPGPGPATGPRPTRPPRTTVPAGEQLTTSSVAPTDGGAVVPPTSISAKP